MTNKRTNWLRIVRISLAAVFFLGITLLLLDAVSTRIYLGWMAKLQVGPLLLNRTANLLLWLFPLVLTLLLGRIYCSVICPLGVLQDLLIRLGKAKWMRRLGNHFGPNRFHATKENLGLRIAVFVIFTVLCLFPATAVFAHFLEPYSLYGKAITSITSSYYTWAAYAVVWVLLFVVLTIALLRGRLWCNTLCPIGTWLSFFSRKPAFAPTINADKCNGCGLCARNCKSECIDPATHTIDMSRCVDCYDCISTCRQSAISVGFNWKKKASSDTKSEKTTASESVPVDQSRRNFLATAGVLGLAAAANAQHKTDGGLAAIEQKKVPVRSGRLLPAGSHSDRRFAQACTACQLCISACPHGVLRPSMDPEHFMQPEMSFERGYCPVGCHACSDVCPAGAIKLSSPEEKTSVQIGHAVWIADNCVVLRDDVSCGNCERHCPTNAIQMVAYKGDKSHLVPTVDTERCIGCGHCEYVCPSRPLSAIYVEPHSTHRSI